MFKYIITTFIALVFSFSSFANTSWDDILNAKKAPQNWLTHHGSLDGHRFSGLKEINKKNLKKLKVVWSAPIAGNEGGGIWTPAGLEGTPLVENGFIYSTENTPKWCPFYLRRRLQ